MPSWVNRAWLLLPFVSGLLFVVYTLAFVYFFAMVTAVLVPRSGLIIFCSLHIFISICDFHVLFLFSLVIWIDGWIYLLIRLGLRGRDMSLVHEYLTSHLHFLLPSNLVISGSRLASSPVDPRAALILRLASANSYWSCSRILVFRMRGVTSISDKHT